MSKGVRVARDLRRQCVSLTHAWSSPTVLPAHAGAQRARFLASLAPRVQRLSININALVASLDAARGAGATATFDDPHVHTHTHAAGSDVPARAARAPAALEPRIGERRLISELLKQFKQTAEVRQFLKYYGSVDSDRFAIIKISGDLLHNEADTARVASALAFLHRIGLVPVVVHGAGVFTGRRSGSVASAAMAVHAGQRPRDDLMAAVRKYMHDTNTALVNALRREGVEAMGMEHGVFSAERAGPEDTHTDGATSMDAAGIAGRITRVNADAISAATAAGAIPVVASLAGEDDATALTFPTHAATMELAKVVNPLKVIWLRPEGGLRTVEGELVRSVNLSRDGIPASLSPADAKGLHELAQLYTVLGDAGSSVSVTSPEHLASELFTHKGAGTQVLRGERILEFSDLSDGGLDVPRVRELIQSAFGATLPDTYFSNLVESGRLRRIYVSEGYRGVAIVTEEAGLPGVAYLDKFAVAPSAQGDKLGEVLWHSMTAREGPLYWRSRSANRVNPWYYEQSTGCFKNKSGDWTVFWRGLEDEQVMPAVATALALPPTFPVRVYPSSSPSPRPALEQPVLK